MEVFLWTITQTAEKIAENLIMLVHSAFPVAISLVRTLRLFVLFIQADNGHVIITMEDKVIQMDGAQLNVLTNHKLPTLLRAVLAEIIILV